VTTALGVTIAIRKDMVIVRVHLTACIGIFLSGIAQNWKKIPGLVWHIEPGKGWIKKIVQG